MTSTMQPMKKQKLMVNQPMNKPAPTIYLTYPIVGKKLIKNQSTTFLCVKQ